jgi:hypothetical protein
MTFEGRFGRVGRWSFGVCDYWVTEILSGAGFLLVGQDGWLGG